MTDLYVVPNAEGRVCNGCGAIHPFLSNGSDGRPCGTPTIFTRAALEQLGGLDSFMGGKPIAPAVFGLGDGDALDWHDHELVRQLTTLTRDADQEFEKSGGGTRHWLRDHWLPRLEQAGLAIVRVRQAEADHGAGQ